MSKSQEVNSVVNLDNINAAENAWLELPPTLQLDSLVNPLANPNQWEKEHLDVFLGRLLVDPQYIVTTAKLLLNVNLIPIQAAILQNIWFKSFPLFIGCRGFGKSFLLAVYSLLRCILVPNTNVILVGSAFRQSKIIFEYMEKIWKNAPILRDICGEGSGIRIEIDRLTFRLNNSTTIAIPIGSGDKIRGLRANIICADEFAAQSPDIFETVIVGFGVVNLDPVQSVQLAARRQRLIEKGLWNEQQEVVFQSRSNNQTIISGTADYGFNHFAQYWRRYKKCIESRGDPTVMEDIFQGNPPEGITWKDFAVIRIPYGLTPPGFLDQKQIARAKATINTGIFDMEYNCIFLEDSNGFFKRSLIERCVPTNKNEIILKIKI